MSFVFSIFLLNYRLAMQCEEDKKKRKVVEVQRGDLVGQFLGSTEDKTANKINEAKGGVLFVDEAYRLTPRSSNVDYGRIAINQLMAAPKQNQANRMETLHR